jgi:hypothetical protein
MVKVWFKFELLLFMEGENIFDTWANGSCWRSLKVTLRRALELG